MSEQETPPLSSVPLRPQRMRSSTLALTFAASLASLQRIARELGYALAVHGSMQTDFDLVACPWVEDAVDAETLVEAIRVAVDGHIFQDNDYDYSPEVKPHGRNAWSIYLRSDNRTGPYIDISVMPRYKTIKTLKEHMTIEHDFDVLYCRLAQALGILPEDPPFDRFEVFQENKEHFCSRTALGDMLDDVMQRLVKGGVVLEKPGDPGHLTWNPDYDYNADRED
jgi:hypothetical protein